MMNKSPSRDVLSLYRKTKKSVFIIGIALTCIIVAYVAFDSWRDYSETLKDNERQLTGYRISLAEHAAQTFNSTQWVLDQAYSYLNSRELSRFEESEVHSYMKELIQHFPHIGWINIKDRNAVNIANTSEYPVTKEPHPNLDYMKFHRDNASTGQLFFSKPALGVVTKRWRFFITRRISDKKGNFAGVIGCAFDPTYYDAFYKSIDLGRTGRFLLIRSDGQILVQSPFSEEAMKTNLSDRLLFTTYLPRSASGVFRNPATGFDQSDRIVSYQSLKPYPIIATVSITHDEAVSAWKQRTLMKTGLTLLFLLLAAYLGYLLFRSLGKASSAESNLRQAESDLRESSEALKSSEEAFRTIFEESPFIMVLNDFENGTYVNVNRYFCEYRGIDKEEIIGKTPEDFNFLEDHSIRDMLNNKLALNGKIDQEELAFKDRKHGQTTMILSSRVISITGKYYVLSVLQNITERKQAEDRLALSEQQMRAILQASPIAIGRIRERMLEWANEAMCKITGYKPEEILGRNSLPLYESEAEYNRVGEVIYREGEVETKWVRKDGEVRDVSIQISQTSSFAYIFTAMDITEQKRAEKLLRDSERLYRAIFENTGTASIIIEEDSTIALVNTEWVNLAGYSREEMEGRMSWTQFVVPEDQDRMREYHLQRRTESDSAPNKYEFRFIRNNGEIREMINFVAMIPGSRRSIASLMDITERKRAEAEREKLQIQLTQAQKMEAIGTLAGGIAHDFNNILGAMMGFAELAKIKTKEEKVYSYLGEILQACDRAKDLVKQILTFSRQTEQEKKPVMLVPLIKEVAKFMRSSLPTTIEIEQKITARYDVVMADATQMHQLLMNLCMNAGHAMKERGGLLEISAEDISVDEYNSQHASLPQGRYLHLRVRDTGHGIEERHLGKIFEPYFTTKKQGEGTGLGLSVVDGIVRSHGGDINVYSEVGRGTVFHIYLPLIEDKTDMHDAKETKVLPGGRETILLVDDEKMLVQASKLSLEELGYRVVAETDPARAVEEFRVDKDGIDLVITDKTMPQITGFDLVKEIKEIRNDIPVIICSGFQDKEDAAKMAALGISHFIAKPIKLAVLARLIRDVLNTKSG